VHCLLLGGLFLRVLFGKMVSDDATAYRADNSVVAGIVSRDATHHGALDTARRMRRPGDGKKERCGGECGFPESGHADIHLF
jgi:hypothetical protein